MAAELIAPGLTVGAASAGGGGVLSRHPLSHCKTAHALAQLGDGAGKLMPVDPLGQAALLPQVNVEITAANAGIGHLDLDHTGRGDRLGHLTHGKIPRGIAVSQQCAHKCLLSHQSRTMTR